MPTMSRIQPTALMSTPERCVWTAKARIAPAATSKMLTPSPMKPPWVRASLYPVRLSLNPARCRRFERVRNPRASFGEPPPPSSSLALGAQRIGRPARRDRSRVWRGRRCGGAAGPLAARPGEQASREDRLRLLVRDRDLYRDLRARRGGDHL